MQMPTNPASPSSPQKAWQRPLVRALAFLVIFKLVEWQTRAASPEFEGISPLSKSEIKSCAEVRSVFPRLDWGIFLIRRV